MNWKPKHLAWKLGSLLIAVMLWIAMSVEPDAVTNREVPLLFRGLPNELLIGGDPPDRVRIELRGPERRLTSETLADTVAVFELGDIKEPGERTFTISTVNLNLPTGVTFLRAVPSQVRLRFAHLKSREVPVEVRFSGTMPKGLTLVSHTVTPQMLRIAGSENRIDGVGLVETDPIEMSKITTSGSIRVNAFINEPQIHFESSPLVTVNLVVKKSGN
jgi:hypothetical protein